MENTNKMKNLTNDLKAFEQMVKSQEYLARLIQMQGAV